MYLDWVLADKQCDKQLVTSVNSARLAFERSWVGLIATCVYLRGNSRVRLATQRKTLRKFNLRLLASSFSQGFTASIPITNVAGSFLRITLLELTAPALLTVPPPPPPLPPLLLTQRLSNILTLVNDSFRQEFTLPPLIVSCWPSTMEGNHTENKVTIKSSEF